MAECTGGGCPGRGGLGPAAATRSGSVEEYASSGSLGTYGRPALHSSIGVGLPKGFLPRPFESVEELSLMTGYRSMVSSVSW